MKSKKNISNVLFRNTLNYYIMESAILQRVKQICFEKFNSNTSAFAKEIGIQQVTFNNYMSGKRKLSLEAVEVILYTFSEISAEWLLRGKGEMLKASAAADTNQISEVEAKRIKEGEGYLKLIKTQNEQIRLQQEQINTLIGLLDNKNYEN